MDSAPGGKRRVAQWLVARAQRVSSCPGVSAPREPVGEETAVRSLYAAVTGQALGHELLGASCESSAASCFDSPLGEVPSLTVDQYTSRISRHIPCCGEVFALAVLYLDRVLERHRELALTPLNVHRLYATAFVVASKFWYDRVYSNKFYAKVAGISVEELNVLEVEFLSIGAFDLFVGPEEWACYHSAFAALAWQQQQQQMGAPATPRPCADEATMKTQSSSSELAREGRRCELIRS